MSAVDEAVTGKHARVAVGGQRDEGAVVEERAQPLVGVTRVLVAGNFRLLGWRDRGGSVCCWRRGIGGRHE